MEPETKLFPAIFVEATSKEILQIELGRSATSLPLSAAVLPTSDKHVTPQFPPRLKVQCLKPHQWARVSKATNSFILDFCWEKVLVVGCDWHQRRAPAWQLMTTIAR